MSRDHDGEVKEVAAAAMNFISNLSKDIGQLFIEVLIIYHMHL